MTTATIQTMGKLINIVKPFIGSLRGKNFTRPILKTALINNEYIIATNAHIAIKIKHHNNIQESYLHHYKQEITNNYLPSNYPDINRITPEIAYAEKSFLININEWIKAHEEALKEVKEIKNNVVKLENNELHTPTNVYKLSINTNIDQIAYNCNYMLMTLKALKQLGNKEAKLYYFGNLRQLYFVAENVEIFFLPVRIDK